MSQFKTLFAVVLFATSAVAHADLPSGYFSGYVSNNPFNEWCRLDRAEMDFRPNSDGSVRLFWKESGFATQPGAGFCENIFDATLTPTSRPNEWTVNFHWNFDLNFGRATLKDGILNIEATFTGMHTGFQDFSTRLAIHDTSLTYERRIGRFGPTLFANGVLYK